VPGGFGAAKNLSNLAVKVPTAASNPDVLTLAEAFADACKPVA
jgi:enhancing lycopene biosynthesis protein 2